jgi:hypothetical protein
MGAVTCVNFALGDEAPRPTVEAAGLPVAKAKVTDSMVPVTSVNFAHCSAGATARMAALNCVNFAGSGAQRPARPEARQSGQGAA